MKYFIALALAAVLPLAAWAHGGEDHGDAVATVIPGDSARRAAAQSEDFELTAVLAGGRLTLYLDRYADNAPVPGAVIEVESGAFKAVAKEIEPGLYALPGEAFAKSGNYPLIFSVQAGETADLLTASLDGAAPRAGVEHAHSRDEWVIWGGAGVLLLAGMGLMASRFLRKSSKG